MSRVTVAYSCDSLRSFNRITSSCFTTIYLDFSLHSAQSWKMKCLPELSVQGGVSWAEIFIIWFISRPLYFEYGEQNKNMFWEFFFFFCNYSNLNYFKGNFQDVLESFEKRTDSGHSFLSRKATPNYFKHGKKNIFFFPSEVQYAI